MGQAQILRHVPFTAPPAMFGIGAAQIDDAAKAVGPNKGTVKAEIGLGGSRHVGRYPVKVIKPIEEHRAARLEKADCVASARRSGKVNSLARPVPEGT